MPEYEFKDLESDDRIDVLLPMDEAPPFGAQIKKYGRTWARVPSRYQVAKVWSRRVEAKSIELNHPDAPHLNAGGEACFQSQAEIDEFCAKTGRSYD